MKPLLRVATLTNVATAMAALLLMTACQTVAINNAELAASRKEFLLAQSGFKVITVTTPKQQQAISGLAQYRVSAVKYNGKLYYVFPLCVFFALLLVQKNWSLVQDINFHRRAQIRLLLTQLLSLPTNPPRPRCPLAQTHQTAELRCCWVRRSLM